ncbi:MAG: hypothetical protein J6U70_00765 [Bacteroidales bacterium]|nr:hypothetical protein [Bacteroidales bacterium]
METKLLPDQLRTSVVGMLPTLTRRERRRYRTALVLLLFMSLCVVWFAIR